MKVKLALGCLAISMSADLYSSDISNVKIERLMVDTGHGNRLFVKIDKEPIDAPECSNNGTWQYVLPLETELHKDTFTSFLLSAYMSGKNLRIQGSDVCDVFYSIETLKRIELQN